MRNKIIISEIGSMSVPANVQMADFEIAHLFGVTYSAVKGKIKTLFKSRYISDCSGGVVRGNLIIPEYFGMEVVIAVAFQVDSHEADLFRRWVMKRLTQQPKLSQTIYLDIRDMPNNIFN